MLRKLAIIAALSFGSALMAGCAGPAHIEAAAVPPVATYPPPRCSGKLDCDQMWHRAYTFVQMASGMKVLTVTDSIIQTYPANAIGRMTGTVQKYPISDADNEIRLALECRRNEDCSELASRGVNLFNMSVAGPPLVPPSSPSQ